MSNFYKKYLKYKIKYNTLKNGGNPFSSSKIDEIPQLCFGTGQPGFDVTLPDAFKAGCRHIDGADGYAREYKDKALYFNMVKDGIKEIPRNELWITWKTDDLSEENVRSIIKKLNCEYIDLLLRHHLPCEIPDPEFVTKGLIRYYGVSNCEDLSYLKGKNIYATQIQARPPRGNLSKKQNFDEFINECNSFGVRVMLYGSTSSLFGFDIFGTYFEKEENRKLVNKYYLQKYIKDKKNILMFSSQSGNSIVPNICDHNKIMSGEDLLTCQKMQEIEQELEKYKLVHMLQGLGH
jgi:diketogulonate reductase-like aldo/keto reductase